MVHDYLVMLKKYQRRLWADKYILLTIIIGSIVWSLTMVKSGLFYDFGFGYWGPNGHDGIWHISLASSLLERGFSMPIFAGATVSNYHIGFDLLLAILSKVSTIPISVLYFQILPPLFAVTIGLLAALLLRKLSWNSVAISWSLFFVYFGGNLGWLVTYIRDGHIGGASMFWAQPAVLTLVNPPFALSLIILLVALIALQSRKLILSALLIGILIQVKAYAAVIVLVSLICVSIYYYLTQKKLFFAKVTVLATIVSVMLFLPFNSGSSSLFVFKPFWFLETMMQFPDRVGWARFGEAMVNYKLAGNLVKGALAYLIAFFIFWYGNVGTRLVAEIYSIKLLNKKREWFDIFVISSIVIGLTIPMFFVQKGTAWNTIQFFYYSLFFISLISGYVIEKIIVYLKPKQKLVFVVLLIVLTIPTTIDVLKHYLPKTPPAMISKQEYAALGYLANQPEGIILIPPFDRSLGQYDPAPRPLYVYESTSYVSAFTGKQVFLEDEVNLDITGFNWQDRKSDIEEFFINPDKEFLVTHNISYIYIPRKYGITLDLVKLFENNEITIYSSN